MSQNVEQKDKDSSGYKLPDEPQPDEEELKEKERKAKEKYRPPTKS